MNSDNKCSKLVRKCHTMQIHKSSSVTKLLTAIELYECEMVWVVQKIKMNQLEKEMIKSEHARLQITQTGLRCAKWVKKSKIFQKNPEKTKISKSLWNNTKYFVLY